MKKFLNKSKAIPSRFLCGLVTILSILVWYSCDKDQLDVQEIFPFEVKVMPVPKEIEIGETVEIRISILSQSEFSGNNFFLRYFQNDGEGRLRYYDHKPYLPNDSYPLDKKEFRLYYSSKGSASHNFDVWIADSFGNEKQLSFEFKNKQLGPIIIGPVR